MIITFYCNNTLVNILGRFTDSNKFGDIWYRKLPLLQKVLWEFLLAECNHAGILTNFDLEMASFKIGADITKEDLDFFENRVIFITENTLFIPKFIEFQYGDFNPKNRVHLNVLKELDRVMKKTNIYIWCNKLQLSMYLNYYEQVINDEYDNKPIGIILCTEKDNVMM